MSFLNCMIVFFMLFPTICWADLHDIETELRLQIKENCIKLTEFRFNQPMKWYYAGKSEGLIIALQLIEKEDYGGNDH